MTIINDINDTNLLDDIFNQDLIIYEDIKGFEVFVRFDGDDFLIKDTIDSNPVNFIDDSIQTFYGKILAHFESLDQRVKSLIPKKWWFNFQYLEDNENYGYAKKAKNNLVLCSIYKNGRFDYNIDEVEEFARLLEVECIPLIYSGKLSEKTIESLKYFLNTSAKDLEYIFGETSFGYFMYRLLNPQSANSFLMNDEFNSNIDKIILKVDGKQAAFTILDPLYKRVSDANVTTFSDEYSLIIINFLNFCQSINLDELKLKGSKRTEVYMYLMCLLFNSYVNSIKDDLLKWDIIVPEFWNSQKFRINKEEIINKNSRQLINENPKLEYFFKCIYFSFRYVMKEPIGLLNGNMLKIFNKYIENLNNRIDAYLNKRSEDVLAKSSLVDFGDFFDIKYDTDSEGNVYPDIVDAIKGGETKKKKKLGGVLAKEDLGKK